MKDYEVNDILDNIDYLDKNQWEQSRLNGYITAQVNSTKKLSPKDIISFSWEKDVKGDIEISNDDIKRLKDISKTLNINGNS